MRFGLVVCAMMAPAMIDPNIITKPRMMPHAAPLPAITNIKASPKMKPKAITR